MTRLIDADKLKEELKINGLGYQYYMLDKAPTVKAIPIEWLKDRYMDGHKQTWSAVVYDALLTILKDWEEENEINRCR